MADAREPLIEKKGEHWDEETPRALPPRDRARRSVKSILDEYFRRILPGSLLMLVLWSLVRSAFVGNHHWCPGKSLRSNKTLVPLEAHIMSKCPDAKDCLEKLVVPSMVEVSDKVNFTLSYIGRYGIHCWFSFRYV
jgi:hypothetical protein